MRWTSLPFELIVVDDGSTDGTFSWLERFRESALRSPPPSLRGFLIARNAKNRGYPVAMSRGIERAGGERVLLGNADAAPGPFWLEGMVEALSSRPRIGGVSPSANLCSIPGALRSWKASPAYSSLKGLDRFAAAASLKRDQPVFEKARGFVPGFWFLARTAVVRALGGFDPRFSLGAYADWDLQWRMRRAGHEIGFAPRVYVHHLWSGCIRRNGLKVREFYAPARKELFLSRYPEARNLKMDIRTPFGLNTWPSGASRVPQETVAR